MQSLQHPDLIQRCSRLTVTRAGDYKTALHAKAEAAADVLINGATDMVFLHIKAVDDTGHDRLTGLKVIFVLITLMATEKSAVGVCLKSHLVEQGVGGKIVHSRLWVAMHMPMRLLFAACGGRRYAANELQVGFLSAIDLMLGHLIKRLHEASSREVSTFIAVTGDHSTPVAYGDHSHEPVPFSIAPTR